MLAILQLKPIPNRCCEDFWSFSPSSRRRHGSGCEISSRHQQTEAPRFIGIYHTLSCSFKGAVQFSTWRTTWLSFQRNKLYLYLAWKWDDVCNRGEDWLHVLFTFSTSTSIPFSILDWSYAQNTFYSQQSHSAPARKIWRISNGGKMRRSTSCLIYCVFSMTVYLFGVVYRLIYTVLFAWTFLLCHCGCFHLF